jgi:hypothetical protein
MLTFIHDNLCITIGNMQTYKDYYDFENLRKPYGNICEIIAVMPNRCALHGYSLGSSMSNVTSELKVTSFLMQEDGISLYKNFRMLCIRP